MCRGNFSTERQMAEKYTYRRNAMGKQKSTKRSLRMDMAMMWHCHFIKWNTLNALELFYLTPKERRNGKTPLHLKRVLDYVEKEERE